MASAVADAKANAGENRVKHARFLKRDLAQSAALGKLGVEPDVVVAGMDCLSPVWMASLKVCQHCIGHPTMEHAYR